MWEDETNLLVPSINSDALAAIAGTSHKQACNHPAAGARATISRFEFQAGCG
jgi:hypothetical protein